MSGLQQAALSRETGNESKGEGDGEKEEGTAALWVLRNGRLREVRRMSPGQDDIPSASI